MSIKDRIAHILRSRVDPPAEPGVVGPSNDRAAPESWEAAGGDLATTADVVACFRLLLGRLPDRTEWRGHSSLAGSPLKEVVTHYLQSLEFTNRHLLRPSVPSVALHTLDGFRMFLMTDDLAVCRDIAALGIHEPAVTRSVEAVLRPGMAFVDVGANVGYFSMLAASRVGPSGEVFAFEPSQTNVKLLHLNRVLNGFQNVRIFPFAAGRTWDLSFYDGSHSNGWVSPIAARPEEVLPRTVVTSAPIHEIVPRERRVDMIKIDVEGAEYQALVGALPLLERHHPAIVSEFSPPALEAISGVSGRDYLRFLTDLGYRLSLLRADATIACDVDAVMAEFHQSGIDHVDILAE
jgi:FkbM family methyltransferase